MIQLAFNFEYFLTFELANLLKLIKIGFYIFFISYFIIRIRKRKADGDVIVFEVYASLFFLFLLTGSILEFLWVTLDPIFFHPGQNYFYDLLLLPTGFTGEALIFFLGFIGLGFLSIGIERGSNLPTKGIISLIPFTFSIGLLLIGMVAMTMPWYFIALASSIIPILFFYIAAKAEGGIRNKALFYGFGFLLILMGNAINYNYVLNNYPEMVGFLINNLFGHPFTYLHTTVILIGCTLLLIGQLKYDE